jgi:hypothetical protein
MVEFQPLESGFELVHSADDSGRHFLRLRLIA